MEHYISGSALRTLRERAGLTQRTLEEQIGVTDKAVSKWETGRGLPDVTLLDSLAKEQAHSSAVSQLEPLPPPSPTPPQVFSPEPVHNKAPRHSPRRFSHFSIMLPARNS